VTKVHVDGLDVFYGDFHAIRDATIEIPDRKVTALIGPSGSGKTTFLRCLNRLHDLSRDTRVTGSVTIDTQDIYSAALDPVVLRQRVGMLFQFPSPFRKSIFENVAFGLRLRAKLDRGRVADLVEKSLREAALWDEVKDVLHRSGAALSGGQQQRLCIARVLAGEPEIILMDEPTSQVDPIATARLEELIRTLKERYTIVIVTHSLQQAFRVADVTAFLDCGDLVEWGPTSDLFSRPVQRKTQDYVFGRYA
jgi:phosphate transport system ATP-binding protein